MKMYFLMAGGLVVVIAVCVGVIHFEAAETRDAMREMARDEIPKGVRDGIQDSIGKAGEGVTSVDNIVGKIESTIGGLAGAATGGGKAPSLPEAAGSAAKVAGDLLGQVRDTVAGPAGDGDTDAAGPGGLLGKVQSTVGDVLGTRRQPPKPKDDDDASADSSGSRKSDSKKSGSKRSGTHKADSDDDDSDQASASKSGTSHKSKTGSRSKSDRDTADSDRGNESDEGQRSPGDVVGGLFDLARGATKAGDKLGQQMLGLSAKEECEWGERLHQQIIDQEKIVHNRALAKRIDRITAPLLSARKRREIDYTFTVIKSEDDDINAFSILGGYIYLHTALIDYVKNDQELQFVLAHEIGHVDLGHCTQQLTYSVRASQIATPVAGQVAGILHAIISRPYTKDQEFEADAYGFKAVIAAGQTRQQALAFPRRFGQYLKDHGLEEEATGDKPDNSVAGTVVSRIKDHFHTHPPMDERISRLEAIDVGSRAKK